MCIASFISVSYTHLDVYKRQVIGYDNTKVAEMSYPPLTTIAQPLYEMGIEGMKILIKYIETHEKQSSVVMPFELIERKSVEAYNK